MPAIYSRESPLDDESCPAQLLPDTGAPDIPSVMINDVAAAMPSPQVLGLVLFLCTVIAAVLFWAAPGRVSRAMMAAIGQADEEYLAAAKTGAVEPRGKMAEELEQLHATASALRQEYLESSLSHWSSIMYLLKGRPLRLVFCRRAIQLFRTRTEIAKEVHNRLPPGPEPIVGRRRRAAAQPLSAS